MPIPFILAGLALGAGVFGIKKGMDAKEDMDRASTINERANRIAKQAEEILKSQREDTQNTIGNLGRTKIDILSTSIKDFVDDFRKIKNVNLHETKGIMELKKLKMNVSCFDDLKDASYKATEIASGGLSSIGAGSLLAYGTYSAVGAAATASTGAAIGGLSGVAATNATLAWLGGGALSAGGLGMAGGMAVLGGLVAGPALAIGGSLFASKARQAVNDAYSNVDKAAAFSEQVSTICSVLKGITMSAYQLTDALNKINVYLKQYVVSMKNVIALEGTDWESYSLVEQENIGKCVLTALAIKKVLDTPLLTEDGDIDKAVAETLNDSNSFIKKFININDV